MNNDITVEDYKIWFPYEVFYIESILSLARSVMAEVTVFHEVVRQIQENNFKHQELLIDSLQNFLTSAAGISRYFWPSSKEKIHVLRGERLREAFDVTEFSPLKDRKLRNFIEHFDENLDKFLSKGVAGNIVPNFIGFKTQVTEVDYFFRAYFLDEAVFCALGLEYKVDPIIQEVVRIHNLAIDFNESGRLPQSKG